ncbi:hypothetical protein NFJ02_19g35370 [Pycnococcus provasolii]
MSLVASAERALVVGDADGACSQAKNALAAAVGGSSSAGSRSCDGAGCALCRATAVLLQTLPSESEVARVLAVLAAGGSTPPICALAVWASFDATSQNTQRTALAKRRVEHVISLCTSSFVPYDAAEAGSDQHKKTNLEKKAPCAWRTNPLLTTRERDMLVRTYVLAFAAATGENAAARALAYVDSKACPPPSAQGYLALVADLRSRSAKDSANNAAAPAPSTANDDDDDDDDNDVDDEIGVEDSGEGSRVQAPKVAREIASASSSPAAATAAESPQPWWSSTADSWKSLDARQRDTCVAVAALAAGGLAALWFERRSIRRSLRRAGAELAEAGTALLTLLNG